MNNITQIATKLTGLPSAGCDFASEDALECTSVNDLRKTLKDSVPFYSQAVIVFRVIAVLYFFKQIFAIVKLIMASSHVKAVQTVAYSAVGIFLLFDIGNSIFLIVGFKSLISAAITKITKITDSTPTT